MHHSSSYQQLADLGVITSPRKLKSAESGHDRQPLQQPTQSNTSASQQSGIGQQEPGRLFQEMPTDDDHQNSTQYTADTSVALHELPSLQPNTPVKAQATVTPVKQVEQQSQPALVMGTLPGPQMTAQPALQILPQPVQQVAAQSAPQMPTQPVQQVAAQSAQQLPAQPAPQMLQHLHNMVPSVAHIQQMMYLDHLLAQQQQMMQAYQGLQQPWQSQLAAALQQSQQCYLPEQAQFLLAQQQQQHRNVQVQLAMAQVAAARQIPSVVSPAIQQQPPAIVPITQVSPQHTLSASCAMHPPVTTASKLPPNVHPVTSTAHCDNVQRKTDRPSDLVNLEQELLKISRPRKWPVVSSPPLSTSTPVMPQTMLVQTAQGLPFTPFAPSSLPHTSLPLMQMQCPDMPPVQYVHSVPDAALLGNTTSIGQTLDLSMLTTPSPVMPTLEQAAIVPNMVATAPESELLGAEKTLITQSVGTVVHGANLAQTAPTLMAQTTVVSATRSTLVSSAVISSAAVKSVAPTVKTVPDSAVVTSQLVPSQVIATDVLSTPVTTPNPVKKSRFSVTVVNEDPLVDKLKQTNVSETRLDESLISIVDGNERSTVKTMPNSTACTTIEVPKTPKVIRKGRFKVMTFPDNPTAGEVTAMVPVTTQETKQPPSNSTSQESLGHLTDGDSVTSVTSVCLPRQLSDSGVSTTSECSIENRSTTSQTMLDAILTGSTGQMTRPVVAAMTPESLGSQTSASNLMSLVHHEMSLLKQETQAKVHVSFHLVSVIVSHLLKNVHLIILMHAAAFI